MKKTALLTAAAALMMASPAMAHGYLGLQYGNTNVDSGGSDTDVDVWQGEGAFGFAGPTVGGQVDGSFGNLEVSGTDVDFWTLTGHIWWDMNAWRFGGVVGTTQLDAGGSDIEEWLYGFETRYNFGQANAFGSMTFGSVDSGGSDVDLWNLDGGLNYYASPNTRVGGTLGWGNIDGGGTDVDTFSFGLNGEIQPWSAPVSLHAGWNYFNIDDADLSSNVFTIGARWNFGGGTVQDRDNLTGYDTYTGYVNRLYGIY